MNSHPQNFAFRLCVFIILSINNGIVHAQSYCDYLYDNTLIFGDFDDTIEDQYGGSMIQFYPSFQISRRYKSAGQEGMHAVISDRYGRLLFHTNGCDVFDRRDSIAENGNAINPGDIHDIYCPNNFGFPGLQHIFFLPSNYNDDIFFLFYIGEIFNPNPNSNNVIIYNNIYQSTFSISSNNGFGGAIEKDKVILEDTNMMGTPINAVRHANGLDWWIITPNRWKSEFFIIQVDQNGGHYIGTQTIGTVPHRFSSGGQGHFSPDGSHFAWYSPYNGLFLYDFDRATGMLSNFRMIEIPAAEEPGTGGLEFSPSGRFLYVNHYFSLYQLDMLSEDIAGSLTHIADFDGFGDPPFYTTFLYQVRTPDGRIFMNPSNGSQWLHVIQEPEKKGTACRFEQHAIKLPTVNNFALPFFPNYRLGALGEPLCDSMIVSVPNPIGEVTSPCHIYPNPTTTNSTLYLPTQWSEAMVYTMDGLLIQKNKSNQNEFTLTLNLADWSPGIYIIEGVDRDGQRCVDKLIIH